ncbi:sugar transporter [Hyaloraphidium curvatum]|nr:sugar transporter [Hyaloraphidium curvatum]
MGSSYEQLAGETEEERDDEAGWPRPGVASGIAEIQAEVKAELPWYKLALATLCLFGVQIVWTVELAFGTPYLLSLGVAKAFVSLVWLAGPLSGLVVQPIVGSYSDQATFRLGRRRPFIIGGTAVVCISLLMLAYALEASRFLVAGTGEPTPEQKESIAALTRWVVVAAFWILDFSLNAVMASSRALVMDIAPVEQQGLASAFAGRMVSLGNVAGYILGFLNLPEVLPALGSAQVTILSLLALFILVACVAVTCIWTHEVVVRAPGVKRGWLDPLKGIVAAIVALPPPLQRICNTQFFAWFGWFSFLFFSSSWVAEVTHGPIGLAPHPDDSASDGARAGSFALFVFALVSLVFSFALPPLARRPDDTRSFANFLPSVPGMWMGSLIMFAAVMFSTIFVGGQIGATVCISLLGVPWAAAVWAPFVLIGEYCRAELDREKHNAPSVIASPDQKPLDVGIVMGIANLYVVVPQLAMTGISALVFALLHYLEGTPEPGQPRRQLDSFGWVLRIGGVAAIAAAYLATKLEAR